MSVSYKRLPSAGERRAAIFNIARRPQTLVILLVSFILILVTLGTVYLTDIEILSPSTWPLSPNAQPDTPRLRPPIQLDDGYGKVYDEQPGLGADISAKVIALVFFGRRELVEVLDCYIQRNLKANGGLLDEVIFVVHTDIDEDLEYLEALIPRRPEYTKYEVKGTYRWLMGSWEPVTDPDAIYVKIDDDVVYFSDNAIPSVVKRLTDNPHFFAVSANVINNPALSWVHSHMGVYYPYWPEMKKPKKTPPVSSWRASELPPYSGPASGPKDFAIDGSSPAPYENHRWLPVPLPAGESTHDMSDYPVSTATYDAHGPSLGNWALAAQIHYSFLQHLEQNDTHRYKFDVWDYAYDRLSINFFAIRGRDIIDCFPFPQHDDEDYLTVKRPKELGRRVVMDGTGIAVHYAFGPQYRAHDRHGLTDTDLLPRYRAYAQEMVCGKPREGFLAAPEEA
ncbi:hypothetical protein Daus18300_012510 [Diaporthe australafricana]|uniref:Uncharacterized protein n=1 Tax=Diaporthe australafricana TaxID=127596 RepID=A0ABR3W2R8_9PEZI